MNIDKSLIQEHSQLYLDNVVEVLNNFFSLPCTKEGGIQFSNELNSPYHDMFVSITVTGTVYGEYILSFSKERMKKVLKESLGMDVSDLETREMTSELLNIVSGNICPALKNSSDNLHLTFTAPRAIEGSIYLPKVNLGSGQINFHGEDLFGVHFYLDGMELDIKKHYTLVLNKFKTSYNELLEANKTLEEQKAQIIHFEKMAALCTLSGGLAHHINTPLSAALISLELLSQEVKMPDEIEYTKAIQHIQAIRGVINKITDIISILQKYTKTIVLARFSDLSLTQILRFSIEHHNEAFKANQIKVNLNIDCENDTLNGSQDEILKAFYCIIDNAREELMKAPENSRELNITLSSSKNELSIQFTNPGTLENLDLSKLTEPFYTTKGPSRLGLGLSLAKGIIEGHQGKIEVNSNNNLVNILCHFPQQKVDQLSSAS